MSPITDVLKGFSLFRSLSDFERDLVAKHCIQIRSHAGGDVIIWQGDEGRDIFLLPAGVVQVEITGNDMVPIPLHTLSGPVTFGEIAFLDHKPRSATVKAVEALDIVVVDGNKLDWLIGEMPNAGQKLMRDIALQLAGTLRTNIESVYRDVRQRAQRDQFHSREAVERYRTANIIKFHV